MKIVYIITSLCYGGAEKLLSNICNYLLKSDCNKKITVVYLKDESDLRNKFDSRIHFKLIKLSNPFSVLIRLRNFLKTIQPDIIHTHLGHADLYGLAASIGLKVKRFVTLHNIWYKWDFRDRIIFYIYRLLFTIQKNTIVLAASPSIKQHAISKYGIPTNRIIYTPNSIPRTNYSQVDENLRTQFGIDENCFVLLFIGRLRIQKSVDTLIAAIPEIREYIKKLKVLIVGEGDLLDDKRNKKSMYLKYYSRN